jgi:hypothetical protein
MHPTRYRPLCTTAAQLHMVLIKNLLNAGLSPSTHEVTWQAAGQSGVVVLGDQHLHAFLDPSCGRSLLSWPELYMLKRWAHS